VLDLAFREKDAWTAVDFKTDRELEREFEHYKRQVGLYALSIERADRPALRRDTDEGLIGDRTKPPSLGPLRLPRDCFSKRPDLCPKTSTDLTLATRCICGLS
jgi:hypothetical protein